MRGILGFLLVAGLTGSAAAQPATKAAPPPAAKAAQPAPKATQLPPIERFTLKNGLEVAVINVDVPVAAVQLWYHAGSKDEPRDRRGSAHMFEHMMFKGTQHVRPEAHAQMLNGIGGTVNAATDEDATHYINNVPPDYVDFAIQLEAERMRNLLFRKEMIDTEREVVKEEVRQQENSPITKGFLRFLEIAFTKHPYGWLAGGNLKDLDATTPQDLKKFYDAYYQPNNAMLVVAGKTSVEQVKASAEKWFGSIPKAADASRPSKEAQEPAQTAQRRETTEVSQVGITVIGWHVPSAKDKDIYAIQVASIILGAGDSSRLKVKLKATDPKTKQALALEAGVQPLIHEDPGIVLALAAYLDKAKIEPVEKAMMAEVKKLGDAGPAADELRKAKNQVQSGFVFSLESAQGLAEAIGRSWIQTGDPTSFVHDVDAIEAVTAADVKRVVKQYFTPEKATVVVIPPAR
ncbi:MAG TPA: pitrilysin family protein [Kofleriaceae bacterium]|nr:pitrilysin family protein [Kofleriaceae bacterium]